MTTSTFRPRSRAWMMVPILTSFMADPALAEDWGAYSIVPASAPGFVLEAVGAGTADGTVVSIAKPAGTPAQKWVIVPKGGDLYAIRPSYSPTLVLAAAEGGSKIGTQAVLETDKGEPWQTWTLRKNDDDGSYCLIPKHAPGLGLDHLAGKATPGAKVDIWTNKAGDTHLRWRIKPLAGTTPQASAGGESPPSSYVPPDLKPEEIPPGQVKDFTFNGSKIFPGTVRQVSVFIPAQYDGSKPACVSVKFDGYNAAEKGLLEALIASKEMPVTIGVFVRPGELPSPVKGTMGRRNRCLEYDGVGDANVRFLVEELLPEVARRFDLRLSTSGNDRCISGGSSGGIAAFNAAWERPDAFSRVYANSGSFVAFRGGHEFPTLVRKTEAKPIRAYLTTGMRDMENAAGDWFLIDQEMDKALKFSGYDYSFRIINGGHVAGYYDHYREAMAYLWKGWPEPVKAGPSAPRVRDVILPDEPWQLVAEGRNGAKAATFNAEGEVFFIEEGANKINKIGGDGTIVEFLADADHATGLTVGRNGGELFTVSNQTGKVHYYSPTGQKQLWIEGLRGRHVVASPEAGVYVTADGEVWFVIGKAKTKMDSGLKQATGLAYRPDQWLLSVADGGSRWAFSYQVEPDGSLENKERFFWLHVPDWEDDAGAEAIVYAKEGQMLVATKAGIQICADDGPTQVILPLPGHARPIGLAFGGRDLDALYAFTGDSIYKRKLKVHGVGAFSPRTPVRGTPL